MGGRICVWLGVSAYGWACLHMGGRVCIWVGVLYLNMIRTQNSLLFVTLFAMLFFHFKILRKSSKMFKATSKRFL